MVEIDRAINTLGRKNTQSTIQLMTLNMMTDAPYRRLRQCITEINKKREALESNYYKYRKLEVELKEWEEKNDELFTTLSTTVRRMTINKEAALISDTVGFISKLPAYMIEAFKSTLEELLYTDTVIVVIDASDHFDELRKKFKSCYTTLNEIGVEVDKMIFALNKSELLDEDEILDIVDLLELNSKKWIDISASTQKNVDKLKEIVGNVFRNDISHKKDEVGVKTYEN